MQLRTSRSSVLYTYLNLPEEWQSRFGWRDFSHFTVILGEICLQSTRFSQKELKRKNCHNLNCNVILIVSLLNIALKASDEYGARVKLRT